MKEYMYRLDFKVRDYEVDMEGVVNNSVYMNYLEHARHEFLLENGIDFAEYTSRGVYMVVAKAELEFKRPLKSGDRFWVGLNVFMQSKVRIVFEQDVYRYPDDALMLKGLITGTGIGENGRPKLPDEIIEKIGALKC